MDCSVLVTFLDGILVVYNNQSWKHFFSRTGSFIQLTNCGWL